MTNGQIQAMPHGQHVAWCKSNFFGTWGLGKVARKKSTRMLVSVLQNKSNRLEHVLFKTRKRYSDILMSNFYVCISESRLEVTSWTLHNNLSTSQEEISLSVAESTHNECSILIWSILEAFSKTQEDQFLITTTTTGSTITLPKYKSLSSSFREIRTGTHAHGRRHACHRILAAIHPLHHGEAEILRWQVRKDHVAVEVLHDLPHGWPCVGQRMRAKQTEL